MLHAMFGPKVPGPAFAALIPSCNGFQPRPVSFGFNEEILRNWIGFLEKRYKKDREALQSFVSIKSPAELASFSIAFWQDAAQDYFSEFAELQKTFWSAATALPPR